MKNIKQKLGFSLVELMIVVAVLGAMTALGVPAINAFAKADAKRVFGNQLNSVKSAIILAGDNDVTFVKEVPINQNRGLLPFLKNLDEMCCPDSGDYYIITNANRIYCPNHNIYSSLIPIEIDTSGGTVNPGDIEPDRPASSSSSSSQPTSSSSSSTPVACSHVAGTPVITKEATCTEDGVARISCTICSEIIETQTVTALGHDYSVKGETVAATQSAQGYTVYKCSRCDATENRDFTNYEGGSGDSGGASEHNYVVVDTYDCDEATITLYSCTHCDDTYAGTTNPGHVFVYYNNNYHYCDICTWSALDMHSPDASNCQWCGGK